MRFAMSSLFPGSRSVLSLRAVAFLGLGLAGCVDSEPMSADVVGRLEALGIVPSTLVQEGDSIVVDGDMLVSREALLAGEYGALIAPHDDDGLVEKGYRYREKIASAHVSNIRLAWATGARAPSASIKKAFENAAAAWSDIPNSALRISTENTGPAITVHMVSTFDWPPAEASRCEGASACADIPRNKKPGVRVFVESTPTSMGCLRWKGPMLEAVARHELGHALGFAHPNEEDSLPVKGTKTCEGTDCANAPGYTTIMTNVLMGNCSAIQPRLTKDDYATAAVVY